jgi:guanylate cyclase 2D/E
MTIVCPILGTIYIRSLNTMATLISAYTGNILVKAAELTFEKKRTDYLLFQMLPPSVAGALTNGQRVPAESFESVSVFFSDIVDFKQLATFYRPLEVPF